MKIKNIEIHSVATVLLLFFLALQPMIAANLPEENSGETYHTAWADKLLALTIAVTEYLVDPIGETIGYYSKEIAEYTPDPHPNLP